MAKNTNRVASFIAYVAALGLATGAWAAHWELDVEQPVTFAKEIFGGDDPGALELTLKADDEDATNGRTGTRVQVQLVLADPANTDGLQSTVEANSQAEITLTIAGAQFGDAIHWNDIVTSRVVDGTEVTAADTVITKVAGSRMNGREGDQTVSVKVTNAAAMVGPTDGGEIAGAVVNFYIGSLKAAGGLAGAGKVTASASVEVTAGPDINFPRTIAARKANIGDNPATTGADEVETDFLIRRASSAVVADSAQAMMYTPIAGETGNIDLDDRTKLDGATQVKIGGITPVPNMMAYEKDGTTAFASKTGVEADIHVMVSGMVRDTDTVYFDTDGDMKMGTKEGLDIEDGVATGIFRLGSGGSAYFIPDGETAMQSGSLKATHTVEYDATSVVDPKAVPTSGMLVYSGVSMQARAYAIPNLMHSDDGNVRIKCEASGDAKCTVFLDCNEQDGMARFGELGDTIAAGATEHLTEEQIADVLGIDDWSGRLSCDVLSANDVSVQVLVRSGESLVNNTYVD